MTSLNAVWMKDEELAIIDKSIGPALGVDAAVTMHTSSVIVTCLHAGNIRYVLPAAKLAKHGRLVSSEGCRHSFRDVWMQE